MNRMEFEQLRDLADKSITAEIAFRTSKDTSPNLTFNEVIVKNSQGWEVVLNGTYKPDIPSVTFNFVVRGVGPICRLDVNGTVHKEAGRTHKHDLLMDEDSRKNLPTAVARKELEGKTAREIWEILCKQANITHIGAFIDPEGDVK